MTTAHPPDDEGPARCNAPDPQWPGPHPRPPVDPSDPAGSGADPFTIRPDSEPDLDAAFSAIVSGISDEMHWGATGEQLDAWADERSGGKVDGEDAPGANRASGAVGTDRWHPSGREDTEDRRRRRELRRAERAESLQAHLEAQAEREAELAADDAHFVPPPPPPLPRPRRRTVAALLLIFTGIVLLAWPGLLAAAPEVAMVIAALLILSGGAMLITGLHQQRRGGDADGWDDGAVV